ncbi:MAG: hypothetical protein JWN44_2173 [Myxococcales bacterium]|nr:hypothetical protein [Myxococcales bacterium]
MGWSRGDARSSVVVVAVALAIAGGVARADAVADRLTALDARVGQLVRERSALLRRREETGRAMTAAEQAVAGARERLRVDDAAADRAALETGLARARELAVALRALDGQVKKLGDDEAGATRERIALVDTLIERAQRELDRDAAALDVGGLRARLGTVAELRRRRDALAATLPSASPHRGVDLAAIVADATESSEALAEKADLVESFARGWRSQREELQRRLARCKQELDLVHRLTNLMETRRRGRLGASDPFAADVEAFSLRERERQLGVEIAGIEKRARELGGWIDDADRRRLELIHASAQKEQQ